MSQMPNFTLVSTRNVILAPPHAHPKLQADDYNSSQTGTRAER